MIFILFILFILFLKKMFFLFLFLVEHRSDLKTPHTQKKSNKKRRRKYYGVSCNDEFLGFAQPCVDRLAAQRVLLLLLHPSARRQRSRKTGLLFSKHVSPFHMYIDVLHVSLRRLCTTARQMCASCTRRCALRRRQLITASASSGS